MANHDDLLWIGWVLLGCVVNYMVWDATIKDLRWILYRKINGSNERDAREAVWQSGIKLILQCCMLIGGVWRLFLQPDVRWWGAINKMTVATWVIIVVSTGLSWSAIRDLRLRHSQIEELTQRRAGSRRTRQVDQ